MPVTTGTTKTIATGGAMTGIPVAIATGGIITAVGDAAFYFSPAQIMGAMMIDGLELMGRFSDGGDWPLFLSHLPEATKCVVNAGAIYDTSPVNEMKNCDGEVVSHGGIQLLLRSDVYSTLWDKIQRIALSVEAQTNVSVDLGSGNIYTFISATRSSGPVSLGMERGTGRRFLASLNYLVTIRKE